MRKSFFILILSVFFLFFNRPATADYWDTGWIEFKQPNGMKFIGRIVGDEYEFQNITKDGYPFDKNPKDNYYYYAERAVLYKYILSYKKVSIDSPMGIEKNLKVFMDSRPDYSSISENESGLKKTIATTYTLKVVLVKFSDTHITEDGAGYGDNTVYTKSDFEDMLSGSSYYSDPDGRTCYGSMDQYYDIMSNGDVRINGVVQNNSPGGQPEWITLPNTKNHYYNNPRFHFRADAEAAAIAAGIDVSVNSTTKLCYIYAGITRKGGLNPHAESVGGNIYVASELCYLPNFKGIGIHCHEFGHLLGFFDLYNDGVNSTFHWALMGNGSANGNNSYGVGHDGTCPAPINPYYRADAGWISTTFPTIPNNGLNLPYDEQNPTVYQITVGSDKYYFENRRYNGYSQFCPGHEDVDGGILVWHTHYYSAIDLIEADGSGPGDVGGTEGYGDMWPGSTNNRSLNDFTTPNSNLWYGGNSNIILHNVSDPAATMTALIGDKWFGEVPLDLTWENNIEVGGNVITPTGINLTIEPGTLVKFSNNGRLEINGKLTAVGTSSDPITFQSVNGGTAKDQWDGILFNSSADNTSSIQYAAIKNANYGIELRSGRKPGISYNTIEYNIYGIYGNNPGGVSIHHNTLQYNTYGLSLGFSSGVGSINYNTVQHNSSTGIELYFVTISSFLANTVNYNGGYGIQLSSVGTPEIFSNTVRYNTASGVYLSNSTPNINGNKIGNNGGYGLRLYTSSPVMNYYGTGYNIIAENNTAMYLSNNSVPLLDHGYNDIIKETGGYHVYINTSSGYSTVYARNNWWGSDDENDFSFYPTDAVVYDPWSHSANTGGLGKMLVTTDDGPSQADYNRLFAAMALERQAAYQKAAASYRQLIAEYGANVISRRALSGLVTVTHLFGGDLRGLNRELEKIAQSFQGTGFGRKAQTLALDCLELTGDYEEAIAGYRKRRSEKGEAGAFATLRTGEIVLYGIGDKVRAEGLFQELLSSFPNSEAANLARLHLAEIPDLPESIGRVIHSQEQQPDETEYSEVEPDAFSISQNYPNPANPTTTINFTLPEASYVTLEIYNLLGQKVRTLLQAAKQSGLHTAAWDGCDEFGKVVSSGIYLYHLKCHLSNSRSGSKADFVRVKKLLLIR